MCSYSKMLAQRALTTHTRTHTHTHAHTHTHTHTHYRVSAVVMFFLEGSVLGYCVTRLSFLQVIGKYMKHWMRAALYMV